MVSHFNLHFPEHICIYSLAICKCFSVKCPFYDRVAYLFLNNLKMLCYIWDTKLSSGNSWHDYSQSRFTFRFCSWMPYITEKKFNFMQICQSFPLWFLDHLSHFRTPNSKHIPLIFVYHFHSFTFYIYVLHTSRSYFWLRKEIGGLGLFADKQPTISTPLI